MARAQVGDRVRMTGIMSDDPQPMEVGAEGTVTYVNEPGHGGPTQIAVNWDNGRSLMLLNHDPFVVIRPQQKASDPLEGPEYLMADHVYDVRGFADGDGYPGDDSRD